MNRATRLAERDFIHKRCTGMLQPFGRGANLNVSSRPALHKKANLTTDDTDDTDDTDLQIKNAPMELF